MNTRRKLSPTTGELRLFGILAGTLIAGLFGGALPWLKGRPVPLWPFFVGAALWLAAGLAPRSIRIIQRPLAWFGSVTTGIVSYIAMAVIFYVIVVPLGILMRLLGRDPLSLAWDRKCPSYRVPSKPIGRDQFARPF